MCHAWTYVELYNISEAMRLYPELDNIKHDKRDLWTALLEPTGEWM